MATANSLRAQLEALRDRWAARADAIRRNGDRAKGLAILQCECELAAVLYKHDTEQVVRVMEQVIAALPKEP